MGSLLVFVSFSILRLHNLRIKLDDQLRVERKRYRVGYVRYRRFALFYTHFQPGRSNGNVFDAAVQDECQIAALLPYLNDVTGLQNHRTGACSTTIDVEVSVTDQLAGRGNRGGKTRAIHHAIQAPFQQFDQLVTGRLFAGQSLLECSSKLLFGQPVVQTQLLFFSEMDAVFRYFVLLCVCALCSRWIRTSFDRLAGQAG